MALKKPKILVFSGYGLNCEDEIKYVFDLAGGNAEIVHINDLVAGKKKIKDYQILTFPGGFSYGDDLGSGKAYANKVKNHLQSDIDEFIAKGGLMLGICNGFQIMTQLGVLPGALAHNSGARYIDRWVDLKVENLKSPWLKGIKTLSLPIAHGEGRYIAPTAELKKLNSNKQIAFRYVKGEMSKSMDLPYNPNGATEDIAGVLAQEGRILGMMPHPERAMFTTQLPNFPFLKEKARRTKKALPKFGAGLLIFKNAVEYVKKRG